jgi:hypothetical protein
MYRDSFGEITSSFTNVVAGTGGTVMLEWTSEGRALTGGRVGYAGVSVVEFRDGLIRRFRTYFDTRDVVPVREAKSAIPAPSTTSTVGMDEPDIGTIPGAVS